VALQVSAGGYHTCAVDESLTAHCWGRDDDRQASPPPKAKFLFVDAGGSHSCGVQPSGQVLCWGWNRDGQTDVPDGLRVDVSSVVGRPSHRPSHLRFPISVPLSCGDAHTCAIDTSGRVHCWGLSDEGQSNVPLAFPAVGFPAPPPPVSTVNYSVYRGWNVLIGHEWDFNTPRHQPQRRAPWGFHPTAAGPGGIVFSGVVFISVGSVLARWLKRATTVRARLI
jgi:hypothetical protein